MIPPVQPATVVLAFLGQVLHRHQDFLLQRGQWYAVVLGHLLRVVSHG